MKKITIIFLIIMAILVIFTTFFVIIAWPDDTHTFIDKEYQQKIFDEKMDNRR